MKIIYFYIFLFIVMFKIVSDDFVLKINKDNINLLKSELNSKIRVLYINNCDLEYIPENIYKLNNLEELYLNNNNIKIIDSSIRKLKKLKILDLSNNKIFSINYKISNLSNLYYLNLSNNNLKDIENIYLINLKYLNISNNKIKRLPDNLFSPNIYSINAKSNSINSISPNIKFARNLRILDLSDNNINSISETISESYLKVIKLSNNNFSGIPLSICKIFTLEELYMDNNKINSINPNIKYLTNLRILSLSYNNISSFDDILWEIQSVVRILNLEGNKIVKISKNIIENNKYDSIILENNMLDNDSKNYYYKYKTSKNLN